MNTYPHESNTILIDNNKSTCLAYETEVWGL